MCLFMAEDGSKQATGMGAACTEVTHRVWCIGICKGWWRRLYCCGCIPFNAGFFRSIRPVWSGKNFGPMTRTRLSFGS